MYKNLIQFSEKTDTESIVSAESRVATKFPQSFKEFCFEFNGAEFKEAEIKAKFSTSNQSCYAIRSFIAVNKVGALNLDDWDDDLVPFAEDSFGNLFVFKKLDMDSVYFWDHEIDQTEMVSDSFEEFLARIEKADYENLPDTSDAEVWINPDFLKQQKDLGNA